MTMVHVGHTAQPALRLTNDGGLQLPIRLSRLTHFLIYLE